MTLPPTLPSGHLAMSGDIFGCSNCVYIVRDWAVWYWSLVGIDYIKHPTPHSTTPHNKELSGPKMLTVPKLRNPALDPQWWIPP